MANTISTFPNTEQQAIALMYVEKHTDATTTIEEMCQMYHEALSRYHNAHVKVTSTYPPINTTR